jgi:WD40 repeat protein
MSTGTVVGEDYPISPELHSINTVKARLASLRSDADCIAALEEQLVEQLRALHSRRCTVQQAITLAEKELGTAINSPIRNGENPTAWLPNELLVAVLLQAPLGSLWQGTCSLVCRRWRQMTLDTAVQRRQREGRWEAYSNGWNTPRSLSGHTGTVRAVVIGDDGRIYSGADDHTVRMWSANTGSHLRTLIGHTHNVLSLAVTRGTLFSGSYDRTIRVWSSLDGSLLQTLRGHTCAVRAVIAKTDGALISGSLQDIRMWAATDSDGSFVFVRTIDVPNAVNGLALGFTGNLYSVDLDGVVRVWSGTDGAQLDTLRSPDGNPTGYSQSKIAVLSGGRGGQTSAELFSQSSTIKAIALDAGGRIFCPAVNDTIRAWSGDCGLLHQVLQGCAPTLQLSVGTTAGTVLAARGTTILMFQ